MHRFYETSKRCSSILSSHVNRGTNCSHSDLLSKSADEVAREVNGLKNAIVAITPDPLEAQKKSQQLDDIVQLLSPLLDVSSNVADVSSTVKQWDTKWQNEETQKVLDWISPLNFWAKQQDTVSRKQDGTCQWLFDDPIFQAWVDGRDRALWCPGLRIYSHPYYIRFWPCC